MRFPIPFIWQIGRPDLIPTDLTHPMFIPPPQELERTKLPFNRSNQSSFTKTLYRKHNEQLTCSVEDWDERSIAQQLYHLNPPFISTRKHNQSTPRHSELLTAKTCDKIQWKTKSDCDSVVFLARAFLKCTSVFSSVLPVQIDRPGRDTMKQSQSTPPLYFVLAMTLADGSIKLLPLAFDCFGSQSQPGDYR